MLIECPKCHLQFIGQYNRECPACRLEATIERLRDELEQERARYDLLLASVARYAVRRIEEAQSDE